MNRRSGALSGVIGLAVLGLAACGQGGEAGAVRDAAEAQADAVEAVAEAQADTIRADAKAFEAAGDRNLEGHEEKANDAATDAMKKQADALEQQGAARADDIRTLGEAEAGAVDAAD